ncbi:MAG: hypothetical protein PHC64_08550 [Candidatus Gastranaerophilales bacterium]|nr:hypothetical protein [Candidatus Gastranaerophilales bacterium]
MKVKPETFPINQKTRTKNVYYNNSLKPFIYNNHQRPLSSNDVSFEGLSAFPKKAVAEFKFTEINEALTYYGKTFGTTAFEMAEGVFERLQKGGKGVELSVDSMTFVDKPLWKNLLDNAVAPFYQIPVDIGCFFINKLGKSRFKDSQAVRTMTGWGFFKNRTGALEHAADVNALRGLVECFKENKNGFFVQGHDHLDPKKSNYSTEAERSLTRLVTGITSAFFLANDAYNLSRVVNDDPDMAKKDKKKRFNQELGRVGLTAYLTLFTLGSLSKIINKNPWAATASVVGSVAIAELVGRLIVGTPILPVSPEKAKKIAAKRHPKTEGSGNIKVKVEDKTPSANVVQLKTPLPKSFSAFRENPSDNQPQNNNTQSKHNGLKDLTWKDGLKLFVGLAATGLLMKYSKNIKALTQEELMYSKSDIDRILDKLRDNGFKELADNYDALIKKEFKLKKGKYDLGIVDRKFWGSLYNLLSFPFNYIRESLLLGSANIIDAPFVIINKLIHRKMVEFIKTEINTLDFKDNILTHTEEIIEKVKEKFPKKINKKKLDEFIENIVQDEMKNRDKKQSGALKNALKFLQEAKGADDIKNVIANKIFYAMNDGAKSGYSNADLGINCKVWSSLITSLFLIADHYNLVMINSEGQDKEKAAEKAKERAIQRIVSILYQRLVMQISNSFLKPIYDASLLGSQIINTSTQTAMEVLTRKSIGMPVGESTKTEIQKTEQENNQAKGLKGKYFRAMAYVTGKKKLSDRQK